MLELNDKVFLALAKKAGFPSREVLKKCKAAQGDRSLFEAVQAEEALTPEQVKKLERWAKQIKRGDLSPLEGVDPEKASGLGSTPSGTGKVKAGSAGKVKTLSAGKVAAEKKAEATPSKTRVDALKTPSASRTPSASKTPSVGKTPSADKAAAKRRKLRQSSMSLPVVTVGSGAPEDVAPPPIAPDEGTKDVPASPRSPTPSTSRTGTAKRLRASTPSRTGVEASPRPASATKGVVAIVASTLVATALVGGSLILRSGNDDAGKSAVADAHTAAPGEASGPKVAAPAVVAPGSTAASKPGDLVGERARRALDTAAKLERDGKEDEASLALDAALETAAGDARTALQDARNALIGRLRERIDRARALAQAGKVDEAQRALAGLRGHFPEALGPDLEAAERFVNARAAKASDARPADGPAVPAPGVAPPANGGAPAAGPTGGREAELARASAARTAVSKALFELDVAAARAALDAVGPTNDSDALASVSLDRKRTDAVARLLVQTATGFRLIVAANQPATDVELRDGTHVIGKVANADAKQVVVATKAGEVPVLLAALSTDCVLRTAYLAAADDPEPYWFARGVLLLCAGDREGALKALAQAPSVPESAALMAAIATHDSSLVSGGLAGAATGERKKKPATDPEGPVIVGLDPDELGVKRAKTWMDDTDGGVPWEKAVDYPSEHYILHTNVKKEYALRYLKLLEAIAAKYQTLFGFTGNDFKYNKNMVLLYRTQEEFMSYEHESPNVGGFYNPGDKKLHLFHGPWKGAEEITTLNVIAHEAVHQFQNLVLRQMDHAPTFVIEGFSTWTEGLLVSKDLDIIVGAISTSRLKTMRRAFKANDYIHLKDLIRTEHAAFSGFHYGHTWGLFHWCFFGPESGFAHDYKPMGKSMKLLLAYWQMCCSKPTTAKDFEDLVKDILGWDMNQLEKAWKDWILGLDPAHDPQVERYEKVMHKKFVSLMEGK